MVRVHGTCIDLGAAAVLLRGPSGSGKSDLALRLIDDETGNGGARLVSDDQVELAARDGAVWASAPEAIAGLMEVRGVGVVRVPCVETARLGLVVDLVPPREVERMPTLETCSYEGISLPLMRLSAFEISAAAKLRLVVRAAEGDIIRV